MSNAECRMSNVEVESQFPYSPYHCCPGKFPWVRRKTRISYGCHGLVFRRSIVARAMSHRSPCSALRAMIVWRSTPVRSWRFSKNCSVYSGLKPAAKTCIEATPLVHRSTVRFQPSFDICQTHVKNTAGAYFWHSQKNIGIQSILKKKSRYGFSPDSNDSLITLLPL
jgi:hypothetical protein